MHGISGEIRKASEYIAPVSAHSISGADKKVSEGEAEFRREACAYLLEEEVRRKQKMRSRKFFVDRGGGEEKDNYLLVNRKKFGSVFA